MPSIAQRDALLDLVLPLLDQPCADCGERYHRAIMEFDHRGEDDKFRNVMSMAGYSRDRILAEIAKCDVVCANCHRLRTYERANRVRTP